MVWYLKFCQFILGYIIHYTLLRVKPIWKCEVLAFAIILECRKANSLN